MSRRRRDDEPDIGLDPVDVTFKDANTDLGEVPLSDLDSFIVPPRDSKGVSEPFHLSFPPIILRHMDVILRSGRFPYLRTADVLRHAAVRHIRWCTSIRQSIPRHMLVALEAMLEDCRDSEQRIRVEEVIAKIETRISYHLNHGETGEALRLLSVLRARIDSSFNDYWGQEVKKTLDNKFFKPLLRSGAVLVGDGNKQ
jgi:hypothetical protein